MGIKSIFLALLLSFPAYASGPEEAARGHGESVHAARVAVPKLGATVAMNSKTGQAVRVGEIFTVNDKVINLVDKANTQIELAPYTVVEFSESGNMKLLRGSAVLLSVNSRSVKTATAEVDFAGRILLSHDHKERSTSVFVLQGEARMVNPQDNSRSVRLERFRGATIEIGGVLPQLVRQLDFASVESWMQGYAWPAARTGEILKSVPKSFIAAEKREPVYLQEVKLEDYFSSIETGDEEIDEPDYYQKKFADPDVVMAEAKSTKEGVKKALSPEEAALISVPSHKIDIDFDILSAEKKNEELSRPKNFGPSKSEVSRGLASVKEAKKKAAAAAAASDKFDPEVQQVLDRLREIRGKSPVVSGVSSRSSRSPASASETLVPDPVYDFSENF